MDDDRSADDITDAEPISQEYLKRAAVIFKQRRQVACMMGMWAVVWVIMSHRVGKHIVMCSGAAVSAVDVEGKNTVSTVLGGSG